MYVTTFTRTVKRRKTGKVETYHTFYSTKSLTPVHAHIRATHPEARTFEGVTKVVTEFALGLRLPEPLVLGGKLIA